MKKKKDLMKSSEDMIREFREKEMKKVITLGRVMILNLMKLSINSQSLILIK